MNSVSFLATGSVIDVILSLLLILVIHTYNDRLACPYDYILGAQDLLLLKKFTFNQLPQHSFDS